MFSSYGASALGARHHLKNQPNQDAYFIMQAPITMICVADGHGGERHFRSNMGAQFAVDTAREVILSYLERFSNCSNSSEMMFLLENDVSYELHKKWVSKLTYDAVEYGTTLLVSFIWDTHIYFMQIGDGRCVVLNKDGRYCFPVAEDKRFIDNQTSSLADEDAWLEIKVSSMELDSEIQMVGVFTDGVVNAYPDHIYDDVALYKMLALEQQKGTIETFLPEALSLAASYSKDDATACLLYSDLRETTDHNDPPSIVASELPEHWIPISQLLTNVLEYKRLEVAHLVLNAFMRKEVDWTFENKLSIKRLYLDASTEEIAFLCDSGSYESQMQLLETIMEGRPVTEGAYMSYAAIKDELMKRERSYRYCYREGSYGVKIQGANGIFHLHHDSRIFLHHIMPVVGGYDPVVGEITQHPNNPSVWGIRNMSGHVWYVVEPIHKPFKTDAVIKLTVHEMTVELFGIHIKIFL